MIVSRRLGHARASITSDVYGHLLPNMQDEAAEMIDDLVTPTEVKLNEPISINNALHTVAHDASKDQDLQHNLNDDP